MTATDYEAEYNNRARVPGYRDILDRWDREAAAYRGEARRARRADLGLSYGSTERQTIDLFFPADGDSHGLALYIHGGYWQFQEPSNFSRIARGLNAHGITVALAGYDLCPRVRVGDIVEQMRAACLYLWQRFGQRFAVYGHSAGGHLTSSMLATDWTALDGSAPSDMTPAGMAVSGLFDLTPLLQTSMNATLGLTEDDARKLSPLHWPVGPGLTLDVVVGGDESSEFLRQSRTVADTWKAQGAETRFEALAGINHFTVVDPLADPASPMTLRLADLAKRIG
jgi:arylformamidase